MNEQPAASLQDALARIEHVRAALHTNHNARILLEEWHKAWSELDKHSLSSLELPWQLSQTKLPPLQSASAQPEPQRVAAPTAKYSPDNVSREVRELLLAGPRTFPEILDRLEEKNIRFNEKTLTTFMNKLFRTGKVVVDHKWLPFRERLFTGTTKLRDMQTRSRKSKPATPTTPRVQDQSSTQLVLSLINENRDRKWTAREICNALRSQLISGGTAPDRIMNRLTAILVKLANEGKVRRDHTTGRWRYWSL